MIEHEIPVLGIKLHVLQGALAGGVVSALAGTSGPWWQRVCNGTAGALTAMYGTPAAVFLTARFFETSQEAERALAFMLGVVGMIACEALISTAQAAKARAPEAMDRVIDQHLPGKAD